MNPDRLEQAKAERASAFSSDGDYVGDVEAIYYDRETGEPEWIGIRTGFVPSKRVLVPTTDAEDDGESIRLPFPRTAIEEGPGVEGDEIAPETEILLYEHYGLEAPPLAEETSALVRHEEELILGRRVEEAGIVRVRKTIDGEVVEQQVPVAVEHAALDRVPADANDSGLIETLPDGTVSIPILEEQVVVTKRLVVRERVLVRKHRTVERQSVTEELRHERVEIEADPGIELEVDGST